MSYRIKPAPKDDGFHRVRMPDGGAVLDAEGISVPERTSYWIRRENDGEVTITVEPDALAAAIDASPHSQE